MRSDVPRPSRVSPWVLRCGVALGLTGAAAGLASSLIAHDYQMSASFGLAIVSTTLLFLSIRKPRRWLTYPLPSFGHLLCRLGIRRPTLDVAPHSHLRGFYLAVQTGDR